MLDYSQAPAMGRFNGEYHPVDWVLQMERYFYVYAISDSLKLPLAAICLVDDARDWFRWLYHTNQFRDWDDFVDKLFIQFRSRTRAPFAVNRQLPVALNTQPLSSLSSSPLPQFCDELAGYANKTDAHKLSVVMSDRDTDVETEDTVTNDHNTCVTNGGNLATVEEQVFDESPQRGPLSEPSFIATTASLMVHLGHSDTVNAITLALDDDQPADDSAVDTTLVENSVHEFHASCELFVDNPEKLPTKVTQQLSETTPSAIIDVKQPGEFAGGEGDCLNNIADKVFDTKQIFWDEFTKILRTSKSHFSLTQYPFDPGAIQLFVSSSHRITTKTLHPFSYLVSSYLSHGYQDRMSRWGVTPFINRFAILVSNDFLFQELTARGIFYTTCAPTLNWRISGGSPSKLEVENFWDTAKPKQCYNLADGHTNYCDQVFDDEIVTTQLSMFKFRPRKNGVRGLVLLLINDLILHPVMSAILSEKFLAFITRWLLDPHRSVDDKSARYVVNQHLNIVAEIELFPLMSTKSSTITYSNLTDCLLELYKLDEDDYALKAIASCGHLFRTNSGNSKAISISFVSYFEKENSKLILVFDPGGNIFVVLVLEDKKGVFEAIMTAIAMVHIMEVETSAKYKSTNREDQVFGINSFPAQGVNALAVTGHIAKFFIANRGTYVIHVKQAAWFDPDTRENFSLLCIASNENLFASWESLFWFLWAYKPIGMQVLFSWVIVFCRSLNKMGSNSALVYGGTKMRVVLGWNSKEIATLEKAVRFQVTVKLMNIPLSFSQLFGFHHWLPLPFDPGGVHQAMKLHILSDNEHQEAAQVLFKGSTVMEPLSDDAYWIIFSQLHIPLSHGWIVVDQAVNWESFSIVQANSMALGLSSAFLVLNLEDKVLIEERGIVMNHVMGLREQTFIDGLGPGISLRLSPRSRQPDKCFIWDPG